MHLLLSPTHYCWSLYRNLILGVVALGAIMKGISIFIKGAPESFSILPPEVTVAYRKPQSWPLPNTKCTNALILNPPGIRPTRMYFCYVLCINTWSMAFYYSSLRRLRGMKRGLGVAVGVETTRMRRRTKEWRTGNSIWRQSFLDFGSQEEQRKVTHRLFIIQRGLIPKVPWMSDISHLQMWAWPSDSTWLNGSIYVPRIGVCNYLTGFVPSLAWLPLWE